MVCHDTDGPFDRIRVLPADATIVVGEDEWVGQVGLARCQKWDAQVIHVRDRHVGILATEERDHPARE